MRFYCKTQKLNMQIISTFQGEYEYAIIIKSVCVIVIVEDDTINNKTTDLLYKKDTENDKENELTN